MANRAPPSVAPSLRVIRNITAPETAVASAEVNTVLKTMSSLKAPLGSHFSLSSPKSVFPAILKIA